MLEREWKATAALAGHIGGVGGHSRLETSLMQAGVPRATLAVMLTFLKGLPGL